MLGVKGHSNWHCDFQRDHGCVVSGWAGPDDVAWLVTCTAAEWEGSHYGAHPILCFGANDLCM